MSRSVRRRTTAAAAGLLVGGLAVASGATSATARPVAKGAPMAKHVLLLSVDGLHQSDLSWWVRQHPGSAMARLARQGADFTNASTPVPSDSFPGLTAQITGGNPSSTGVYYDDTWNRALLPAGTTNCEGATPGVEVTYFEQLDKNPLALDAGQGLAGLPSSILQMTGQPREVIDPTQLPVDPNTCQPVYPHSYLRVNTIFEVARQANLRTAWSDKHPAYELADGNSGTGVQDLFTPEINSNAPDISSSIDWTKDNALTQQYDNYKVQSVLNEIKGFDHSGTTQVGVPAIFGMNFQSVSTAQKLPTSGGQPGGYLADGVTPGPVLTNALGFVDSELGQMQQALQMQGLTSSTVIILSAKHGQSPMEPSALTRIPDGPIMDGLNQAWAAQPGHQSDPALVAFSVNDDGMLIWLSNRSPEAETFAKHYLLTHSGTGNDINKNPKPYTSSGLQTVYAGQEAADYFHVAFSDDRVPDIIGIAQHGTVYTGGHGKIAEHGGADVEDRNVPIVVGGVPVLRRAHDSTVTSPVETTQIAPTILQLLGLDPNALQAVQLEGTQVLPLNS